MSQNTSKTNKLFLALFTSISLLFGACEDVGLDGACLECSNCNDVLFDGTYCPDDYADQDTFDEGIETLEDGSNCDCV